MNRVPKCGVIILQTFPFKAHEIETVAVRMCVNFQIAGTKVKIEKFEVSQSPILFSYLSLDPNHSIQP